MAEACVPCQTLSLLGLVPFHFTGLPVPEAVFTEVQKMRGVYPKRGFHFLFLLATRTGEHLCHQAGPVHAEPGSSHWRRCHPDVPTRSISALLTQHLGIQRFGGLTI